MVKDLSDIDLAAASAGKLSEANRQVGAVPNEELVRMYEMLRPGCATHVELMELADRLVGEYSAPETVSFVREAADAYQTRRLLRHS